MPTTPPTLDDLPAVPDRSDRVTFAPRATAMFDAFKNVFVGQVRALATNVFNNATDASNSASTATTKAGEAASSATAAAGSASTANTKASEAASSASSAAGSASTATTKAGEASTSAADAATSATAAAASVASISGGPVTSVNGKTGVAVLAVSDINEVAAPSVASAATVDLGASAATTINITGTTGITSFGTSAEGVVRRLVFTGVLALTHNGTSLILPGAANITTAAGDVAEFRSLGGGNWKCISYQKADGSSVKTAAGIGAVGSYTGAASQMLTAASPGYQSLSFTAMGLHVTLPDATTMAVGGPKFILKNDGGYPFGIRDAAGTLVMAIAPGGIAYVTLKDNGTAAGAWSVIGDSLEPGLITIDNTFSSTYASTVLAPFVALDNDVSIHCLQGSAANTYYLVAVNNATRAVGTPVLIGANTTAPGACFKVSATTAIFFYSDNSVGGFAAVVASVSGTTITLGTPATRNTAGGGYNPVSTGENFTGEPKFAQLSSGLFLFSFVNGGAPRTSVFAISVSGTTITLGATADIITTGSVQSSNTIYSLSSTTALVLYKSGASAPYANNAVVISVSGTTCTVGTPVSAGLSSSTPSPPSSVLLSATKAMIIDNANDSATVYCIALTISGTSVSAGSVANIESGPAGIGTNQYTANLATRYNPHLWALTAGATNTAGLWYVDSAGVSRVVVLSETSGTITAGATLFRSISGTGANPEGGIIAPQGAAEFIALRGDGASSISAYKMRAVAHKISGTAITAGACASLDELPIGATHTTAAISRLSSGDIIFGPNTSAAPAAVGAFPIVRSNGIFAVKRGAISCPGIVGGNPVAQAPTFSNRMVYLGSSKLSGSTVGASTYQLRLLNVEIAA